jgi:hypothetical protein
LEYRNGNVRDVLENVKYWSAHTQEYLAKKVNENLPDHLQEELGEKAADLAKAAGISHAEVTVDGPGLRFPGGRYKTKYVAEDKRTGHFVETITFRQEWFSRPDQMLDVLVAVSMSPREIRLQFSASQKIEKLFSAIQSRGWEITSNLLPDKFSAKNGQIRVELTADRITFTGFLPSDIFGDEADPEKQDRVQGILRLLPKQ